MNHISCYPLLGKVWPCLSYGFIVQCLLPFIKTTVCDFKENLPAFPLIAVQTTMGHFEWDNTFGSVVGIIVFCEIQRQQTKGLPQVAHTLATLVPVLLHFWCFEGSLKLLNGGQVNIPLGLVQ